MHTRIRGLVLALMLYGGVAPAGAQPYIAPQHPAVPDAVTLVRENRAVWTGVGAGAGFGLGIFLGLAMFDQAINAERKVWTTAIVSAVAGGVIANLLARKSAAAPLPSPPSTSELTPETVRLPSLRAPRTATSSSRFFRNLFAPVPAEGAPPSPTPRLAPAVVEVDAVSGAIQGGEHQGGMREPWPARSCSPRGSPTR